MTDNRPLVFVEDTAVLDELLRLAAAVGCELERVPDVTALRQRWKSAPLVVLDRASTLACKEIALVRRPGVVLACTEVIPSTLWQDAVSVGAENVVALPAGEHWLSEAFADVAEGPPPTTGRVLAVVGGRGGAGASVFAAAIGLTALRRGEGALLIDCDPLGGGLDMVLGAESEEGLRWPEVRLRSGRVAVSSLRSALPGRTRGGARLTMLSCHRGGGGPGPDAVVAVLDAGKRAGDTVVCDLPRSFGPSACAALDRADLAVLVVPAEVRACVAAAQLAKTITDRGVDVRAVVRVPAPGGLPVKDVAEAVGVPVVAVMRPEPGLARAIECGEFRPKAHGPLSTASGAVLDQLTAATAPRSAAS